MGHDALPRGRRRRAADADAAGALIRKARPPAPRICERTVREISECCPLTKEAQALLDLSVKRIRLCARAYHRVLKLARTIADLTD
ncbi:MAG: hypothetical protein IPK52_18500 [Chloroflexi bacterium]|nr:hypothetical protein [Chloroflexota bacterium]